MKERLARVGFCLVILGLTSLATLKAIGMAWRGEWEEAKNVLRLQDKAASAATWKDGRYTVSANCGERGRYRDCAFCRFVRRLMGAPHCDGASRNEIPLEEAAS